MVPQLLWGLSLDGIKFPKGQNGSHTGGVWEVEVRGQRYAYADLELISPIFRAHEDDAHTWPEQVRAVLNAVTTGEFRSCVNITCGLHVHVGRGTTGFSTAEARQIAAAATMLERCMDRLHPHDRWSNIYAYSLRSNHKIEDLSTRGAFDTIMETKSLNELVDLLHKDRDFFTMPGKVNLFSLVDNPKTVEFRQHEGTLSLNQIQSWVRLVTNIVSSAVGMDKSELGRIANGIQMLEEMEEAARKRGRKLPSKVNLDPLFNGFVHKDAHSLRSYYEDVATKYQDRNNLSAPSMGR